MISQSDNTAADALHVIVGEAALKPYRGSNVPFLTTLQLFKLKSDEGLQLLARYRAASDGSARTAIVGELNRLPAPLVAALKLDPQYADVEWQYSVTDLCRLAERVESLPLFSINPGVADAGVWKRVAYKGGSDAGVMNMTTFLTAKNGSTYCVSATENDRRKQIDEKAFAAAYAAVLRQL